MEKDKQANTGSPVPNCENTQWKPGQSGNPAGRPHQSYERVLHKIIRDKIKHEAVAVILEHGMKGAEMVVRTTPEAGFALFKDYILPALGAKKYEWEEDLSTYKARKNIMKNAFNSLMRGMISKSEFDDIADATDKYQKVTVQPAVEKKLEEMGK